ncbi:TlpA disulfide reductase family protein [Gallaecimonas sp. GXIMD4217]|uniref:TlpA family protein disulfide reductase n=1 Tax=Gallaecimonas sp. GXIMD4217 TaxID=3131927 RepID=UPI00311B0415
MKALLPYLKLLLVFGAFYWLMATWKESPMLEAGQGTQARQLVTLSGQPMVLGGPTDKPTLVYFFAPWCSICRHSIPNLQALAAGEGDWRALTVALDFDSHQQVQDFVDQTGLTLPVLLGDGALASAWQVPGYPAYYVLDEAGTIKARNLGYSTRLGLWLRAPR